MEERVIASWIRLIIVIIMPNFKLANGILCHGCSFEKIGSEENFDPECKYGPSLRVERKECNEHSVVHSSDVADGGYPVTLAHVRRFTNPSLSQNQTRYGCQRAELSGKIGGEPALLMSRSCIFVADKDIGSGSAGCRKGNEEELRRWIPKKKRGQVELDYFEVCICFEDKCNSGMSMLLRSPGAIILVWMSVVIAMAHSRGIF